MRHATVAVHARAATRGGHAAGRYAPPEVSARERKRARERERKGRERNKIWNSGYRVCDRDKTGTREICIKYRISITRIKYFFLEMEIEVYECGQ